MPTRSVLAREDGRPLRVIHVVEALVFAGMEYGVIKVANRLDPARVLPGIVCLRFQSDVTRPVLDPRVRVVALNARTERNWGLILMLARVFRDQRADVVHSHNWQTYLYALLAARLAGVRVVIHGEHGHDAGAPSPRRLLVKRGLSPLVTRFVAVSEDLARELVRDWRLAPERISSIPNGVDLDTFRTDVDTAPLREEFGLSPDHRVITSVGGIRVVKDHPTLVRAFARVHARRAEARLLIVGSDFHRALKDDLVRLAESLGVSGAIRFLGIRRDVPGILALTDVYVNSSSFEGMSNTILEAMAMEKPVVATSVGGNAELAVHGVTGYLVPPGDDVRMAERIESLLSDEGQLRSMGRAGRERVERRHRMERMVTAYRELYEETWVRDRLRRRASARERVKRLAARGAVLSGWPALVGRVRAPRFSILTYHRVLPLPEALAYPFPGMVMARDAFEQQIAHLARRHRVVPLSEGLERLRAGTLPPRAVAITFDDGYRDNWEYAWPILQRFALPATFFLVTDVLDRRQRLWWDEVVEAVERLPGLAPRAFPPWARNAWAAGSRESGSTQAVAGRLVQAMNRASRADRLALLETLRAASGTGPDDAEGLMMTWEQAREMVASGMTVATHTRTHAFLDELSDQEALGELAESRARLEEEIGVPVRWAAYPRGRALQKAGPLLSRAGIEAAVTTRYGPNRASEDPAALRRIDAGYVRLSAGFDRAVFDLELAGLSGRRGG